MHSNAKDDELTQEAAGSVETIQVGQAPFVDASKKHFHTFEYRILSAINR